MSTDHHKHEDQRFKPNATGEQVEDRGIQAVPAGEIDQRWHDVLANFIDDPRGSVLAATELVVDDVSAFVAVLDQRKKSMLNASPEDDAATTEDLRQAAATYRDISKQLTASIQALRVAHRGKRARDDLEVERREVIGGRFDAAGGRQVMPHRDPPPGQTPPEKSSSQDQRR
jgi:hypothetical protein